MSKKICDMTEHDLEEAMVGKSITSVDEGAGSITLSDGTILFIENTSDCCAWFDGSIRSIDLSDNVVTGVRVDDRTGNRDRDYVDEDYTITVLSASTELLGVDIEGTASNGYYVHSVDLRIVDGSKCSECYSVAHKFDCSQR